MAVHVVDVAEPGVVVVVVDVDHLRETGPQPLVVGPEQLEVTIDAAGDVIDLAGNLGDWCMHQHVDCTRGIVDIDEITCRQSIAVDGEQRFRQRVGDETRDRLF